MDKRKLLISILAGFMALVMLLGLIASFIPTRVSAATSSELLEQLEALEADKAAVDAEIQELQNKIDINNGEMMEMVAQKDLIDQEITLLYEQVNIINSQISAYNLLIADKQEQLTEAEANFAYLTDKNRERIQTMEEEGEMSYWSVLFQANSFSDLLDRVNMVQEIAASDKRRLEELDEAAKKVSQAKESLTVQKAAVEATKLELEATQATLDAKRAEADVLLAQLVEKGMEYDAYMDESEALQAQLMIDIANKEDEYEEAKYQEWLATSVPPTTVPAAPSGGSSGGGGSVSNSGWSMPIYGATFTSAFGNRWHPVYGGYRFHYGVDLAAPTGTPIYASRSGVVDTASYQAGGAGNYVQINHGDGYRSIYMHMDYYIVGYGQYVSQGQVIGYCGSTGGSTGPHLHFGISYNGTYVNPANYIPI